MNGLDIIIRDNLKWHARALVAAIQRDQVEHASTLYAAGLSAVDASLFPAEHAGIYQIEYDRAWDERRATRGL